MIELVVCLRQLLNFPKKKIFFLSHSHNESLTIFIPYIHFFLLMLAQSAGTAEYTDFASFTEG